MFFKSSTQKKIESLGISFKKFSEYKKEYKDEIVEVNFLGRKIKVSHAFWFTHSVEELFIDEVYKFQCNTDAPIILDCGANWGLSIIYFKKLFPKAIIIGFEPDKKIFELLNHNIGEFQLSNVQVLNKAVWSSETALNFSSDGALGGSISHLGINDIQTNKVNTVRLKDFLTEKIDFLKIDIEGAELEILRDIEPSLTNVKHLFLEYHGIPKQKPFLGEILSIIERQGFRYYIMSAYDTMKHPFIDFKNEFYYDLQLNIFCYRK